MTTFEVAVLAVVYIIGVLALSVVMIGNFTRQEGRIEVFEVGLAAVAVVVWPLWLPFAVLIGMLLKLDAKSS